MTYPRSTASTNNTAVPGNCPEGLVPPSGAFLSVPPLTRTPTHGCHALGVGAGPGALSPDACQGHVWHRFSESVIADVIGGLCAFLIPVSLFLVGVIAK